MWLASSGLSVPRPQFAVGARATIAAFLVVDMLTTSIAGFVDDRGDHLGRERIADDAPGDAGFGADLLLQIEIRHLVIATAGRPR